MTDVTIDQDLEEAAYNFFDRSDGNVSVARAVEFARLAYQAATRAEDPRVAELEGALAVANIDRRHDAGRLQEAAGGHRRVAAGDCDGCSGTGLRADYGGIACGRCGGSGRVHDANGIELTEMRREQDELRDVILSLAQGTGDAIEKINDESVLGKPPDWTEWRLNAREVIKRARAALARLDAKGGG